MDFRTPTAEDAAAIREIASRSMAASYSLSPQAIKGAVRLWYDDETFAEKLADDETLFVLASVDGEVVGFSESVLLERGGDGDINWLHVDPDYRGEGYGRTIFQETRERLLDAGADRLRGRVLRNNPDGNEFYEGQGFTRASEGTVKIDGTTYVENVWVESEPTELSPTRTKDDREVFVDHNDTERGSLAPFKAVYLDPNGNERYGYACSNCESLDIAMDAMGRLECNDCGNQRKATRWDAAYM